MLPDLFNIALTRMQPIKLLTFFVDLLSLHHSAECNIAGPFQRVDEVAVISHAQAAHQDWALLRSFAKATVFLLYAGKLLPAR
jgi:hypothetical protein